MEQQVTKVYNNGMKRNTQKRKLSFDKTLERFKKGIQSPVFRKMMFNVTCAENAKEFFYKNYTSLSEVPEKELEQWIKIYATSKGIQLSYKARLAEHNLTYKEQLEYLVFMNLEFAHDYHALDDFEEVFELYGGAN